jgi:hypothetical protein
MQIFLSFYWFICELTVKTTEHTVASYESSDFTWNILTVFLRLCEPFFKCFFMCKMVKISQNKDQSTKILLQYLLSISI